MPITLRVWLKIILWAGLIAAGGALVAARLDVRSDLRLFLPRAGNAQERILLEELKEGPGTRLMLVALSGASQARLATVSEQLTETLRAASSLSGDMNGRPTAVFSRVENGILRPEPKLQEQVFRYRYLLTPRPEGCACGAESLHAELQNRLSELGSPAGTLAEDVLLRDPSGEMQAILDAWIPDRQPRLIDGVWFSADARRALLLLQTSAAGFDADGQHAALDALRQALHRADPTDEIHFEATGPGAFTALLERTVRGDVNLLGTVEGIGSFLFLFFVLRSLRHVVLGTLTLTTAGVVALLGVMLLYPSVHGITLAFGFTLLGVAMDYPVHLMLHLDGHTSPHTVLRHVWPTLRLSIATTCIAYFALVFAGFTGLAQLGTFTVGGLLATACIIRWLAPGLLSPETHRPVPRWVRQIERAPRLPWLPTVAIPIALAALIVSPHPLWNNELSGLTPVPQKLLDLDARLRQDIAAPDLRYLLAIRAPDLQGALQRDEALRDDLDGLVRQGVIGGYEQPSRQLPSVRSQTRKQRQLPDEAQLRLNLRSALADLPFKADAFEGFIADVNASRHLRPLEPGDLAGTSIADRLSATLFYSGKEAVALVTFNDVRDPARLTAWAQSQAAAHDASREAAQNVAQDTPGDATQKDARTDSQSTSQAVAAKTSAAGRTADDPSIVLIDLKGTSEQLVDRFRDRALVALGIALILIGALMLASLSWRAMLAVLLPVVATLLTMVALFNALGTPLNLFHIVSLLLVGGLCFDYGLFFNRSEHTDEESLRTRFAVMVCWLSTTGSFALLLVSHLPVLRAIGSTVAGGVTVGFFLALLARHSEDDAAATDATFRPSLKLASSAGAQQRPPHMDGDSARCTGRSWTAALRCAAHKRPPRGPGSKNTVADDAK